MEEGEENVEGGWDRRKDNNREDVRGGGENKRGGPSPAIFRGRQLPDVSAGDQPLECCGHLAGDQRSGHVLVGQVRQSDFLDLAEVLEFIQ